jgi:hypothetical protein
MPQARHFYAKTFSGPYVAKYPEKTIVANIIQQKQNIVYLQTAKDSVATSGRREPYASLG